MPVLSINTSTGALLVPMRRGANTTGFGTARTMLASGAAVAEGVAATRRGVGVCIAAGTVCTGRGVSEGRGALVGDGATVRVVVGAGVRVVVEVGDGATVRVAIGAGVRVVVVVGAIVAVAVHFGVAVADTPVATSSTTIGGPAAVLVSVSAAVYLPGDVGANVMRMAHDCRGSSGRLQPAELTANWAAAPFVLTVIGPSTPLPMFSTVTTDCVPACPSVEDANRTWLGTTLMRGTSAVALTSVRATTNP